MEKETLCIMIMRLMIGDDIDTEVGTRMLPQSTTVEMEQSAPAIKDPMKRSL